MASLIKFISSFFCNVGGWKLNKYAISITKKEILFMVLKESNILIVWINFYHRSYFQGN